MKYSVSNAAIFILALAMLAGLAACSGGQPQETGSQQIPAPTEDVTGAVETEPQEQGEQATFSVERLVDGPIIYPELDSSIGENIQGPTLLKVPEWVADPLGTYYLYFADHKGSYIRLAYADSLEGPWSIYEEGALSLSDTTFLQTPPELTPEQEAQLPEMAASLGYDPDSQFSHDLIDEATTPHIASPSVIIDEENQQIIMYLHGLKGVADQVTRVATSQDGLHFEQTSTEDLGKPYMRVFTVDGEVFGMAMPGQLYKADSLLSGFTEAQTLLTPNARHHDVLVSGDTLYIFWTQVGDAPEQIYVSTVDISKPWEEWTASEPISLMKPERDWEGADAPIEPSIRSTAYGHVNQLRDPFIYEENGQLYILYSVAGESGIGIAKLLA